MCQLWRAGVGIRQINTAQQFDGGSNRQQYHSWVLEGFLTNLLISPKNSLIPLEDEHE